MKSKFATAINCIDGRVQLPVTEFIKNKCGINYVDMITVPGPDKILSEYRDAHEIKSIKKKALFSYKNRNSKLVFIASHYNCLGNPCAERDHLKQLKKAVTNVKKWFPRGKVRGIWVNEKGKAGFIKKNK